MNSSFVVPSRRRKWHVHLNQGWVSSALVFVSPSNTDVDLYMFICGFSCSKDRLRGIVKGR